MALRSFRETHPDVEVILSEVEETQAVMSGLGRGRLELAFALNPEPDERVEAIPLLEDPYVILTRRDSAIADVEHPSFDLIDGLQLVAWTRRWASQVELEDAWRRRGVAPRIVYRTDDNLALQRLVAAGLGHACIGRLAARRAIDPSLTWLAPRERLTARSDGPVLSAPPRAHRSGVRPDLGDPVTIGGRMTAGQRVLERNRTRERISRRVRCAFS